MAFPDGWGQRAPLVINAETKSTPAYKSAILLTEDNLPLEMFNSNSELSALNGGGDIRFSFAEDGSNRLACEIIEFVTDSNPKNGTAIIWVKVPKIAITGTTTIYVWYNKSGETQPLSSAIAEYHFEGDVTDEIGDFDGAITGTETYVDGKTGQAFDFDGSTYIDTGLDSEVDNLEAIAGKAWSVSTWVKNTDAVQDMFVGRGGGAGTSATYGLYQTVAGYVKTVIKGDYTTTTQIVNDGEWHHLATTWDGLTGYVYVDGIKTLLNIGAVALQNYTVKLGGTAEGAGVPYTGALDDTRFYDFALTEEQINSLYNYPQTPETDRAYYKTSVWEDACVAAYHFEENALDSTVNDNDGTLTGFGPVAEYHFDGDLTDETGDYDLAVNTGVVTYIDGVSGQAVSLSGSNYPYNFTLPAFGYVFSFGGWFYADNTDVDYLVTLQDSVTGEYVRLYKGSNFAEFDSLPGEIGNVRVNVGWDKWEHIYCTSDGTTMSVYVNGALAGSATATPLELANTTKLSVGGPNPFHGSMDDFRIYDYALSADEISALYNRPQQPSHWVDGVSGKALAFNGSNGAEISSIQDTTAFTACLWAKSDTSTTGQYVWLIDSSDGTRRRAIAWNNGATNTIGFYNKETTTWSTGTTAHPVDGEWHYFTFIQTGTDLDLYIDAVFIETITITGDSGLGIGPIGIGYAATAHNYNYTGELDDIRIYNRALTPAEISVIYRSTLSPSTFSSYLRSVAMPTFRRLLKNPKSKKTYLVEISPKYRILDWTLDTGTIYYTPLIATDVTALEEDGDELTEVTAYDDLGAAKWYHDKDKLYVQCTTGIPHAYTIVATLKKRYATEDKQFGDNFYEGIVLSIPVIKQKKNEVYYGVSAISKGQLSLINKSGALDNIYKKYAWNNCEITILLGGEDIPYAEYAKMFSGLITDKHLSTGTMDIKYEDKKATLEKDIPVNAFSTTDYPNLQTEDSGRPIPLIYGSVFKIPVVCTTAALGSSTSLHSFKICDTSVCSLSEISSVYVNDVSVSFQSSSVSTASFKLATSTFNVGDDVTVSVIADEENPIEQIKSIASNVLSIPYNSTNYNTSSVILAASDAEVYKCGTFIGESTPFLQVIGDLMQSCMGSFFNDNDGKYAFNVWDIVIDDDLAQVDYNQIKEGSFSADAKGVDIKSVVRIGWRKSWGKNKYSYKQSTNTQAGYVYGVSKSKTINTYLSDEISAETLLARLQLIFETETNVITFKTKIQLAEQNIGDRIHISFKRKSEDEYFEWIDSLAVEIREITKDFLNNEITIKADDLKSVGISVGHWASEDPVFPAYYGGGSMAVWDSTWSADKKAYAVEHGGFWTDENGFIDPTDPESVGRSKWW